MTLLLNDPAFVVLMHQDRIREMEAERLAQRVRAAGRPVKQGGPALPRWRMLGVLRRPRVAT